MDLGRPVKWIEDRLEHLATGGQAREEMADIEAAVTSDGLLLGRADGRQVQRRVRIPLTPSRVPCSSTASAGRSRGRLGSRGSPPKTHRCSATRAPMCRIGGRGPPPTSSGSGCSTSWPANSASTRSRYAERNYVERDRPPLAMLNGQPFTAVTTRECVEQAALLADWDGFRKRQDKLAGRRTLCRNRHGVLPRSRARAEGAGPRRRWRRPRQRDHPRLGGQRRADRRHHPPAAPRPGPRDDAGPGRLRRDGRATSTMSGSSTATPTSRRSR